jgi:putative ABC transport system substrate-binding protein
VKHSRHRVGRRAALLALAGLGASLAPRFARAQAPAQRYRIGLLTVGRGPHTDHFVQALRRLGYLEGGRGVLEHRSAEGDARRLPRLAAELVRLEVDVIVAADPPSAFAARATTKAIPIVMRASNDPVTAGLVTSLARPGGNVTGVYSVYDELTAKRLAILKEAIPGLSRAAVLWNSGIAGAMNNWRELERAAQAMRMQLQSMDVRDAASLEPAFAMARDGGSGALLTLRNPLIVVERRRVIALAAQMRLPTMFDERDFVEEGGLMSYGASLADLYAQLATYVDKILKGARAGDLPVEQAAKLELAVNLRTARAIGTTIAQAVLLRADRVIE